MLKNEIPFLCTLLSTLPSFLLFCEEIILFINNSLQCGGCLFFYCLASHYSLGNSFTVQISRGFHSQWNIAGYKLASLWINANGVCCKIFSISLCLLVKLRPKQSPNMTLEGFGCNIVMTKIFRNHSDQSLIGCIYLCRCSNGLRMDSIFLFLVVPPLGVVNGRLLQRQARVGIQNHGRFCKGTELRAAPVAPRLGWNRPCGLQRVPVLQQAPEQHPGRGWTGAETGQK